MTAVFLEAPRRLVDVTIDGETVRVREGATLLEACRQQGIDTPTLCYLENLTPVNVCRVCVVELEGARTLVPSCSRRAEAGMSAPVGHTPMQFPQYTQAEPGKVTSYSVDIRASKPRPATAIAKVFCASSPQASTHL